MWNPFISLAVLSIPVNTAIKPSRAGTSCICTSMPFTQSSRLNINSAIKTLSSLLGPFQDPSDLLQFVVESFDGPKKYHCGLCNKFGHNGKAHVRNHIEAVHYPNTFLYSCDQCGQSFPSKNNAQLHKSRVHKRGEINDSFWSKWFFFPGPLLIFALVQERPLVTQASFISMSIGMMSVTRQNRNISAWSATNFLTKREPMLETMWKPDTSPTRFHTVVTSVEKNVHPRAPYSCTDPGYINQIAVVDL